MASFYEVVTIASSVVLRISTYIFLRWIPSHQFPIAIYTSFVLYISGFLGYFFQTHKPKVKIASKEITFNKSKTTEDNSESFNPASSKLGINLGSSFISQRHTKFWYTLLLGLPNPKSVLLSLISFTTNFVLVFGVLDLVYTARLFHQAKDLSFARLGYVSSTEAKIVVREPNLSNLPIFVHYRLLTPKAGHVETSWTYVGAIESLGNKTDYTAAITISVPNTLERTYQWKTSTNHTGTFTTPPIAGDLVSSGDFTFLVSSCIKARFPYNPLAHALHVPGFRYLSQVLKSFPRSQFMLFLGDFIYIDVPKRFGVSVEDYRREYRQIYASPDWPPIGQNLSWIHVLDDHEIANDWDRHMTGVYHAAVDPWHHYQTAVNPPNPRVSSKFGNSTYFEFTQGPASFFMLDTRTYRDSSKGTPAKTAGKTMLGPTQLSDLLNFLQKPEVGGVKWKFVISSIPFTKNWRVNAEDTWAGYLHERRIILEAMWDASLKNSVNIIVLSGDRHEFAATAFPPPKGGKWPPSSTVNEYSVGPLSQFYLPIPTYKQLDNDDVKIKYIPTGNSKFGVITIKKAKSTDQSLLCFRLYINGKEAWSNTLLSPLSLPK